MQKQRLARIISLGLPIVGGMVSQNVLNLVDTAMVGTLGDAALAAVGMAGFANFMSQAFITGLSAGVQAMSARRIGEGREDHAAVPLNGGLLLAFVLAVPLTFVLETFAYEIFSALNDDPAVVAAGVPYWQARLLAVGAVGMNFSFRGYFNGVNLSKLYLRTLVLMHVTNIALSYVLIFGEFGAPELGVQGAGIGSTVATYIGTAYYFLMGWRHARANGFLRGMPDRDTLRTMLRLSIPNGVQQFLFASGLTALFWIVGQVGTAQLAAANVIVNVNLVALLPGIGLGLAGASLVGQALGRGEPADAKRWGWDVVKVAMVVMGAMGLPMVLTPQWILSGFVHESATLAMAAAPMRLAGAIIALDGLGMVLLNAHLGAGDTRTALVVSVTSQWGFFLPLAYWVGPILGFGLMGIWMAYACYRVGQAIVLGMLWRRGKWALIAV